MFKKLHSFAQRCPTVQDTATPEQIAARFNAKPTPRCIVLVDKNRAPKGIVCANTGLTPCAEVLILQKNATPAAHLQSLKAAREDQLCCGVILASGGRFAGWVPPEKVAVWLARTASVALRQAESARAELEASQEQSMMLIANMGHELRTPLNAVIGYADLIRSGAFGPIQPAQYGQYVDAIFHSGEHLVNSINAVLHLAKIDAKALELDEEAFTIPDLITQTLEMVQTEADRLDVRVAVRVPDDFPKVYGDPQLLRQALLNLLSNAVKFSPAGSRVVVSAARTARGGLRITVRDRGCGIPAEELPKIMLPFKQAKHGVGRTGIGTGLGLSLAKAFTELHEGRLHLLSEEGKGTRAILTLPCGRVLDDRTGFQSGFAFVREKAIA